MPYTYPLLLDLAGRLVVIVGGSKVALRKVKGLIAAGADRVRVVAPVVDAEMPQEIDIVRGKYDKHSLDGANLVFAATDSAEVNDLVVADARARGIWVNRADVDDENPGDFTTPAMLREGELLITVSAGGSPALAAAIRDAVADKLDRHWADLVRALRRIRPMIRERKDLSQPQRAALFRELASAEALAILSREGEEGLLKWIQSKLS